jgi:hypothetical protein
VALPGCGGADVTACIEWKVEYCRVGVHSQVRFFQTEHGAKRFVAKVTAGNRPDLAPLEWCRVSVREVGPWEVVARPRQVEL